MQENNKTESEIDWKTLDDIIRQWAVMSQWQTDLDNYEILRENINNNIQLSSN